MGLSIEQKNIWNTKLLDTLTALVEICEKNNFRYYLGYGTALGAVRHGGMIPWDDDIDIVMPRPDYEKFRIWCQQNDIGNYHLFSSESDKDFYTAFMKFANMGTTLLESKKQKKSIGIYVDIFPIDGCPSNMTVFLKRYRKLKLLYASLFRESNDNNGICNGMKMLIKGKFLYFIRSVLIFVNREACRMWSLKGIRKLSMEYLYDNSEYVCSYLSPYTIKERMPRSIYGEGKKIIFEGRFFVVPENVEKYLSIIYGDYMKLPPIEQRQTHHNHAYVNFNKHISLEALRRNNII